MQIYNGLIPQWSPADFQEEVIAVTEENAKKLFAIISVENTPTSASGE